MPEPEAEFDPLGGLSAEDLAYIDGHRKALSRQHAVHAVANTTDDERKKAAEEHMRATQIAAGVTPTTAGPPLAALRAAPSAPGQLSIMIAIPDGSPLPPSTEKFAPDWASMKEIIAKFDGTWVVVRHEFPGNVANVLGFFGKDGWEKPAGSEVERFEVIVKSGRVFRTDP